MYMQILKSILIKLILICRIMLSACSFETFSSYSEPEILVSDFLDAYFNVSLEDAEAELDSMKEAGKYVAEMPMHEFFTQDGLVQAKSYTYELMMLRFAKQYSTDIILSDSEIVLADSPFLQRYNFEVTVDYPQISLSEEVEKFVDVQQEEDGVRVTDQIQGYIDVLETDSGWMINSFRVRSASGSY